MPEPTEDWRPGLSRALDVLVPPVAPAAPPALPALPALPEAIAWARSGAMALTGRRDGPPRLSTGTPANTAQRCLDTVASALATPMPGLQLLGERAAAAGFTRNAPWSAGGAFRALPARDGWLGLSLGRPSDRDLVPALIEADPRGDEWSAVARWIADQPVRAAAERAQLLGLAAAPIPSTAPEPTRPGVITARGGTRRWHRDAPLVVDLSALWAGPLCAHLLGLGGARVIKVESSARPDGARYGPPDFFDRLHAGHESVAIDFDTDRGLLVALLRAADVVIESSRPRALRQLGVVAEEYVASGAIWVSITAYGRDDAHALRVGFGDDVAAGAGLVHVEDGIPWPLGDALADPLAGLTAAAAASVALSGASGALLDVSMHDVAVAAAQPAADERSAGERSAGEPAYEQAADEPVEVLRSADSWVVSVAGRTEPVAEPWCRPPAGRAADLGRDTAARRAEFAG